VESAELKEHADMHIYKDIGFRQASENGHLDIVKYLLTFKLEDELIVNDTQKKKLKI
jgi:hypothetical protein